MASISHITCYHLIATRKLIYNLVMTQVTFEVSNLASTRFKMWNLSGAAIVLL